MSGALLLAAALVVVLVAGRWLRVSQREHYLAGQALRTAQRWARCRPPNGALAVFALGLSLTAAVAVAVDRYVLAAAVVAAFSGVIFPWGMPLRGNPPLRFTRRARTLGVLALALALATTLAVGLLVDPGLALALAAPLTLVSIDAAAAVLAPVERRLAARHVDRAVERLGQVQPRVIAVTGSYGKTSTKNHVRDLLAPVLSVVATPASWNNQAGLSRAITEQLAPGTEVFVAEMGTYGPGEIAAMVDWLPAEVAVFTAVGPVHLERMGTLERIVEAKAEIFAGATVAVVCTDHPLLADLADRMAAGQVPTWTGGELWRVGSDPGRGELDVLAVAEGDEVVVLVRGEEVGRVPAGAGHPGNLACAVAAAVAVGAPTTTLHRALGALVPVDSRARVATSDRGVTVVDDTFNSNPEGARAALALLGREVPDGRRVVVTPGMVELGPEQDTANRAFAAEVVRSGAELVVVGWTNRSALRAGAEEASVEEAGASLTCVPDRDAAREWVRATLEAGDGVLWENDLPDHYP